MADKTLYVYEEDTGEVSYTIDNPSPKQLNVMKQKGIVGHLDDAGISTIKNMVTVNAITQQTEFISKTEVVSDYIVFSDDHVVANGTHRVIVSNLKPGSRLLVYTRYTPEDSPFVIFPTEDEPFYVFDAHSYSTEVPESNMIKFMVMEGKRKSREYFVPVKEY